ncbi:MAG TPA: hypothetical protein VNZ49_09345 [Bacteroidia bacterium]|jgi:hypothetical protein|nr:hypothetical protein [Bacteroidia bacterium]
MRKLIILSLIWLGTLSVTLQNSFPDLTKPEDLARLGVGKIIEKDNSIVKQIILKEVKEYWIVYLKDESMHDKYTEYIKYLEFPNSKWGKIKIEFPNNKPEITLITTY